MKRHSQAGVSLVLCAAMLALFAGSVWMLREVDRQRPETHLEEALYIPSAKALKRMSLGYNGLLADIYWTRAVQYFGWRHKHRETDYHLLYPLLEITTELDPHLIVAYRFGATFLAQEPPDGAGEPDKAAELIERGIKANPNDWHLYYDLGFLEAMERHDYAAAAEAFERGSKLPNAHPFLRVLAANMAQHGGDLATARMMWETTYASTDDPALKMNAEMHLKALEVDETVPRLEALVKEFRQKTGVQPTGFQQLVQAGLLSRIPIDPLGHPYKLLADGRVEVQDPEALSFIRQGLPPKKHSQAPEKP
ncbi:MAG: tetratricopeptide repeat protein [Terriglobales bacterium]